MTPQQTLNSSHSIHNKNANGSHSIGSVAFPENSTLTRHKNKSRQRVIDLSLEDPDKATLQQTDLTSSPLHSKRTPKRQRKGKPTQPYGKKNPMDRSRVETLQSRTSSFEQLQPLTTTCYHNTFPLQPQLCSKQWHMEETSPPMYPFNLYAATTEPLWQPTIHTYSIGVPATTATYVCAQNLFNPYIQHPNNTNRENPFGATHHWNQL